MAIDLRDKLAGKLRHLMSKSIEPGPYQASILAIAASKGGVGKTTTAINLALQYASKGHKTLILDLDPQAHVASSLRPHVPSGHPQLSELLLGRYRELEEVTYPTRWPNLFLAGSDKNLAESEMLLASKIGKELLLEGAMKLTQTLYEVIIIDSPPNVSTLTLNGLCAASHLLIPCDMSVLALEGVGDILNVIATLNSRLNRTIETLGVLATRIDGRTKRINSDIEKSVLDIYGDLLLDIRIPQSSAINRAHICGTPLIELAPGSPGALAYDKLATALAPKLLGKKRKRQSA